MKKEEKNEKQKKKKTKMKMHTKDGPGSVMVIDTLCPAHFGNLKCAQ